MPTQQEQIDWLIKQVNSLKDAGCGCQECEESSNLVLPQLKVSYGKAYKDFRGPDQLLSEPTFRKFNFQGAEGKSYDGISNLLIVDVENWEEIKDYSPVILLDRYRHKEKIGQDSTTGGYSFRKAGYRHEEAKTAELNNRRNEVELTGERTIVDFIPENYFRVFANEVWGRGMSKDRSTAYDVKDPNGPLAGNIKIALRIRLTINGEIVETNQLLQLRMTASINTDGGLPLVNFNYAHI